MSVISVRVDRRTKEVLKRAGVNISRSEELLGGVSLEGGIEATCERVEQKVGEGAFRRERIHIKECT